MKVTKEISLTDFKFWSYARQHKFTFNELKALDYIIDDVFSSEVPSETTINDLFWHDEELICEWLGINIEDYESRF